MDEYFHIEEEGSIEQVIEHLSRQGGKLVQPGLRMAWSGPMARVSMDADGNMTSEYLGNPVFCEIEPGANVHCNHNLAIRTAAYLGSVGAARDLFNRGADIDEDALEHYGESTHGIAILRHLKQGAQYELRYQLHHGLQEDSLVQDGKPTELFHRFMGAGLLPEVLARENWKDDPEGRARVIRTVPPHYGHKHTQMLAEAQRETRELQR